MIKWDDENREMNRCSIIAVNSRYVSLGGERYTAGVQKFGLLLSSAWNAHTPRMFT